jgi:PAS domain S-box-containing protein
MLIIDPDSGTIVAANHAAATFYGWAQEALCAKRISEITVTTREVVQRNMADIVAGTLRRFESRHRLEDGTVCDVEIFCGPLVIAGRRLLHSVIHDISARKRDEAELTRVSRRATALAEELAQHRDHLEELVATRTEQLIEARRRAEEASRAKSLFLANMSHEIRTPMNAILGFAQLLRRDPALTGEERAYVDTILRSGEHLLDLINDILDMSKIEAGRVELCPEIFDLHASVAGVAEMFSLAAASKDLVLRVDLDAGVPRRVRTDRRKLRQVLVNLIGNAVKFTVEGEVVVLARCDAGATRLSVEVRDTGPGMSEAALGRIFLPFEQADAGLRAGGTGLGLAISREFVRLLGGEIRVVSVVGEGSSFCFDIPIEAAGAGDALVATDAAPSGDVDPARSHRTSLTPSALGAVVSSKLLEELSSATRVADHDLLVALIAEVGLLAPEIAGALHERAARFEYDSLLELFEPGAHLPPG